VHDARAGARVDVPCSGRRCPFQQRVRTTDGNGEGTLTRILLGATKPQKR